MLRLLAERQGRTVSKNELFERGVARRRTLRREPHPLHLCAAPCAGGRAKATFSDRDRARARLSLRRQTAPGRGPPAPCDLARARVECESARVRDVHACAGDLAWTLVREHHPRRGDAATGARVGAALRERAQRPGRDLRDHDVVGPRLAARAGAEDHRSGHARARARARHRRRKGGTRVRAQPDRLAPGGGRRAVRAGGRVRPNVVARAVSAPVHLVGQGRPGRGGGERERRESRSTRTRWL